MMGCMVAQSSVRHLLKLAVDTNALVIGNDSCALVEALPLSSLEFVGTTSNCDSPFESLMLVVPDRMTVGDFDRRIFCASEQCYVENSQ
eukprot:939561-Amphidinium_carterae.1